MERHQAGHSNETFFVRWGDRELVLRRPPGGAFLPTAHDVLREHRILSALQDTDVRIPRTVVACEDPAVIGAPFYLMSRVPGRVVRREVPPDLDSPAERRRIGEELVDALVELHAVEPGKVGLEGLGRPDGYLARQVKRWTGQLDLAAPFTAAERDVPELREVGAWLAENVPASPNATIVHGDYKLDNVVLADGAPARVAAILDWEMATLGDPWADVGWMLSFWSEGGDPPVPGFEDLYGVTAARGFLSRRAMLDRYAGRAGRETPAAMPWYVALAVWKLAILLEGSYARHLFGVTDDPFFARLKAGVPALARRASAVAAGDLAAI
ncbi:MAG: phosphotransferase family protein [Methanobacteriota archaeon]